MWPGMMAGNGWEGMAVSDAAWDNVIATSKDSLVVLVKNFQRTSPGHKQAWDNYCIAQGTTKFDPSKKEETFLQQFLNEVEAGNISVDQSESAGAAGAEGNTEKATFVDKVKQWQRQGEGHKRSWWSFCAKQGSQDYDPNRHDVAFLQSFIAGIESGEVQPEEGGAAGGGGWSKGEGKWAPWDMTPDSMMKMFQMFKGYMKGKGKGSGGAAGGCGACGGKGMGKGAGKGAGKGGLRIGEIRYDDPAHANQALQLLDGSTLQTETIEVCYDPMSMDGTKLIVKNVPASCQWQELKDHFKQVGVVAFAGFKDDPPPSQQWSKNGAPSWGGGGMGMGAWGQMGGGGDDWWDSYGPMMMAAGKGKGWASPY